MVFITYNSFTPYMFIQLIYFFLLLLFTFFSISLSCRHCRGRLSHTHSTCCIIQRISCLPIYPALLYCCRLPISRLLSPAHREKTLKDTSVCLLLHCVSQAVVPSAPFSSCVRMGNKARAVSYHVKDEKVEGWNDRIKEMCGSVPSSNVE